MRFSESLRDLPQDNINHSVIIHELNWYEVEVPGRSEYLIKLYLEHDKQSVHNNFFISTIKCVTTGVAQESIHALLLFIIHVDDIFDIEKVCWHNSPCWRRDNASRGFSADPLFATANDFRESFQGWRHTNCTKINECKIKAVSFCSRNKVLINVIMLALSNNKR